MESHAHLGTPVAKASDSNRRAGQVHEAVYTTMLREVEDSTIPEVQRTNLDSVCGLISPPAETLIRALEQLCALSALDDRGELAKMGWRMAEFSVDPQLSKMLIKAAEYASASPPRSFPSAPPPPIDRLTPKPKSPPKGSPRPAHHRRRS
jgi:hypothetical protein